MIHKLSHKKDGEQIVCLICCEKNICAKYSTLKGLLRHYKSRHSDELNKFKTNAAKPTILANKRNDIEIITLKDQIKFLSKKVEEITPLSSPAPSQVINNNNTIYFNKDLKYYPELVKIMGKEKACNYLLYGMPETRDIFGVIDKLFLQNGATNCPFRYDSDTGEFLIARAEGIYDRDPTGETIDRENKSKLQDAILSAYVDTTTAISKECSDLRIFRLNSDYTEADQEKLSRRFDSMMTVEPARPYEVIDLMNGLKPKKRDYDKIKKLCPAIIKKITIS